MGKGGEDLSWPRSPGINDKMNRKCLNAIKLSNCLERGTAGLSMVMLLVYAESGV